MHARSIASAGLEGAAPEEPPGTNWAPDSSDRAMGGSVMRLGMSLSLNLPNV